MLKGLDQLTKQLKSAQSALEELDGELGVVKFNSNDPESIEAAILAVEMMVDEKLGQYADSPIIAPLAEQMKEKYREAIVGRAAEARLVEDKE